jgi:predicted regulator of Ras-like GTPase activity (Roadblock/LC7/MglB family)
MATLPQLVERDIHLLDETLRQFIAHTGATTVLIIDKGGFVITHQGDAAQFDLTTIGALASGAFMANQTIAGLVNEPSFNSIYQQGENYSMYVVNVDEHCLLVVIFKAEVGVGVVKYFAGNTIKRLARRLKIARERNPDHGLDLSVLNVANPHQLFHKKDV